MSMPRYVHAYAGSIVASPATTLFSEFRNNGERMTKVREVDRGISRHETCPETSGMRLITDSASLLIHRSADRRLFFPPCEHRRTRAVQTITVEVYSKQVDHRRAEYLSYQIFRHLIWHAYLGKHRRTFASFQQIYFPIYACVWFLDRPGSVHVPARCFTFGR